MKILVAVDGSQCSRRAVDFLGLRTWNRDDCFFVLTVNEIVPAEFGLAHMPETAERFDQNLQKENEKILTAAASKLKEKLAQNSVEVMITSGNIAPEICRVARESDIDLVVLGSHGRKGLKKFFLGSVAEEVLKMAPCSVAIIRAKAESK
ncbi:MAG: universal stress protein [Candidatus Obscuribacterales bacterium]|nr:universal stress protein [Candidatus Obscuribacterales bacterium]